MGPALFQRTLNMSSHDRLRVSGLVLANSKNWQSRGFTLKISSKSQPHCQGPFPLGRKTEDPGTGDCKVQVDTNVHVSNASLPARKSWRNSKLVLFVAHSLLTLAFRFAP